jgi:hypothetical protein
MKPVILISIVALLGPAVGACSTIPESTALVDGGSAPPPAGWTDFCARHAEDPGCRS